MAPSTNRSDALGPLNPGNVVSAALRLYRDRFKLYFRLAAIAYLWLLAGVVGLAIVIGVLGGLLSLTGVEALGALGIFLGVILGLVPLLYATTQFLVLSAVISRLTFRHLINQPETATEAQRQVEPKRWSFLALGLLITLIWMAAYIVLGTITTIPGLIVGFLVGSIFSAIFSPEVGIALGIALGGLVFLALFLISLVWLISRLWIPDVILAIELETTANNSISRSWDLTKTSVVRIQFVVVAAFLITFPILFIANYLPQFIMVGLEFDSFAYWAVYALSLVLSFLGGMVILPFWQIVKGVLYYDLRSRREGLDLQLRNPPLES